jgi:hypothetical protein
MWVFTAVSTAVAACSLLLSLYNFILSRREPVRSHQAYLRSRLKDDLYEIKDHLTWARDWFETDSDSSAPGLDVITERTYQELSRLAEHLVTPTGDVVERLAEAVRHIGRKGNALRAVPLFGPTPTRGERRLQKAELISDIDAVLEIVNAYIADLIKIQKGAIRHKRLFSVHQSQEFVTQ